MRLGLVIALGGALLASAASAADYRTLRNLQAPPPTQLAPLPADAKPRPVQFARIVVHPRDGEAWALAYESFVLRGEDSPPAISEFLTWDSGRVEAETAAFQRAFDDELRAAGFQATGASSLFGDDGGGADLKVGVMVDDIKGRFCLDCPNLFNRKAVPASVVMTAHWEVYSALERRVIARVTTSGGANHMAKLQGSVQPVVLAGFRENVRQLLASEDFRQAIIGSAGASTATTAAQRVINVSLSSKPAGVPRTSKSVALIYAADGSGSGFLISPDGYVLTNHHVVGSSKYVKLKWSDGSETLGEVIRSNPRRDVALIKTDAKGRTPLALRRSAVQQGEAVFAIGTPLDERLQNTMTKGIVSAVREYEGLPFIQSDVGVTHGNSGGPLIDETGAVIGMTVIGLYTDQSKGLNLFIPIADALDTLALKPAT